MPPTIYKSFWKSLDGLPPTSVQGAYRTISSSLDSTKTIDAPYAWLFQDYTGLTGIARAKLPSSPPKTGTLQERMPKLEQTHFLNTEADILRASFLYLVHPVHIAVSDMLETGTSTTKASSPLWRDVESTSEGCTARAIISPILLFWNQHILKSSHQSNNSFIFLPDSSTYGPFFRKNGTFFFQV